MWSGWQRAGNRRPLSPLKRAQIIRAGKMVFLAQGFGAASVDDIAASAGVSKMTVYRHFRNKELLFAGVIDALCPRNIDDDLESLLALPPRTAPDDTAMADALSTPLTRSVPTETVVPPL